ncbi:MAG TPA: glutamine--tRNA ligase/YqeY domain fusion protein [Candidatus Paceibacterota bacterium]|nr:glutamine--tRNA ligase/YqeY domain fusion protein [Verrucomicrobiota bacterium]HRY48689.1 glutamine--tRNA ligase/YqeY domain fusion protein [Candidatus Paceibacterota bacterium]HRZ99251.1 glutamine--tRNA ligase/YqeY domain fusion protein [Candidatus Paceibacterota bacterium]
MEPSHHIEPDAEAPLDFIRQIVAEDVQSQKHGGRVITRFPPEPNGYLHIGHAKSICLNFGIARDFNGVCNLRMDDTNPTKEDVEYVDSITADVQWLIQGWADQVLAFKRAGDPTGTGVLLNQADGQKLEPFYASDYFPQIYEFALELIRKGRAYVCDLSPEDTDAYRGSPDRPGRESPFRNRSIEENLDLFQRMKAGEFPDGARTLRAKIEMGSPNIWLRDPVLYRIRHADHHHTGSQWCIYPMYDFAHCLSDYLEGVTHSICTLEFEVHRPLYDWILEALELPRALPHQHEFARLNLAYTVMSKRKLLQLVNEGRVVGWNDPRMPTLSGMRRRGYPAAAIRAFCEKVGVAKRENIIDMALLEFCVREELNRTSRRMMGVLKPLKVILLNYPEDQVEPLEAVNNPEDPAAGIRQVPFSREIFIEQDDFREIPPPKYFRLTPGGEVRLRYAYIIKCVEVIKNAQGEVTELHCTADLDSKSGGATSNRKVKGTIHWVSAPHAVRAEVRLYDRLFTVEQPDADAEGRDFKSFLNPQSLETLRDCRLEPALEKAAPGEGYQFERLGYFHVDPIDSQPGRPVFNRTVTLRDSWAKIDQPSSRGPSRR